MNIVLGMGHLNVELDKMKDDEEGEASMTTDRKRISLAKRLIVKEAHDFRFNAQDKHYNPYELK